MSSLSNPPSSLQLLHHNQLLELDSDMLCHTQDLKPWKASKGTIKKSETSNESLERDSLKESPFRLEISTELLAIL